MGLEDSCGGKWSVLNGVKLLVFEEGGREGCDEGCHEGRKEGRKDAVSMQSV